MPLFNYKCSACGATSRRICSAEESMGHPVCKACRVMMDRDPTGPTTQKKEVLNPPGQYRAVERLDDAAELFSDRSKIVPK